MIIFLTSKKNTGKKLLTALLSVVIGVTITTSASAQNDSLKSSGINSVSSLVNVTMAQFTGGYSNGFVQLKWSTIREIDMNHFEIERSTDGITFRKIGQTQAEGDSDIKANYKFIDILAEKGSNFYRLVMIDRDGNFSYSKPITIGVEAKGISLMVVYPNPFSKTVRVKFQCEVPEQISIQIIDNTGSLLRKQAADAQKGENNIEVKNVDELLPGVYYLEVVTKNKTMRVKLMKGQ